MLTVLDTNVVVSALLFRGETAAVHRAAVEARIVALLTPAILGEYVRVLSYPKLRLTDAEIRYLIENEIRRWFRMLTEPVSDDVWIPEDPSDDAFINAAQTRPGTVLVSGDRHILAHRDALPVRVVTVRELIAELASSRTRGSRRRTHAPTRP